ncbi:phosphoribosylglycinamide formyltransferase [Petrotoga sp. 9PWA.NaAc.5.4]|uniref:phosphoribosylglycinamide formyltransferase n=1 Tax=Petrotoga sp. 9PWA.NaAc.5.4 TaxID=1434328 RepID=UPI000EFB85A1|nr:phosphoribosylglycinamide formyltransferase [Petrotoga sp. 9PWA.NaAc.5.4]
MKEIIILASGNGTNFEAICNYFSDPKKNVKVKLLITDNKKAFVIKRSQKVGIDCWVIDYHSCKSREEYNKKLFALLKSLDFDLIVLAGYMRILPDYIVKYYEKRIVNIHPSLLPNYKGLNAIERSFNNRESYGGITIHYVDEGVDTGEIIFQKNLKILKNWTLEKYEENIHKLEHQYYPQIIEKILKSISGI